MGKSCSIKISPISFFRKIFAFGVGFFSSKLYYYVINPWKIIYSGSTEKTLQLVMWNDARVKIDISRKQWLTTEFWNCLEMVFYCKIFNLGEINCQMNKNYIYWKMCNVCRLTLEEKRINTFIIYGEIWIKKNSPNFQIQIEKKCFLEAAW